MSHTATRQRTPRTTGGGSGPRVVAAIGAVVLLGLIVWLLWAAAGDDGGTDGGEAVDEFPHVHGLAIPAWGDGDVYVSTHAGAFRIAAGDDWTWISEQPHDFMGFAAHPTDAGVFYSSGHPAPGSDLPNPLGFMVSTDHAATWEPRALTGEVDFHAMAVSTSDGDVIYGYDGRQGLLRSTDAGNEWERLEAGELDQLGGAFSLAVGTGDADEVLAGTEAGLVRSTDAGGSWDILLDAPVSAVDVDASDPTRIVAYAAAEGQGLSISEDGGASWRSLGLVLEDDVAGHVAIDPTDPDTVWVGTVGASLWRTTDGGGSWEQVAEEGSRSQR